MDEAIDLFPEQLATPDVIVQYLLFIFIASCGAIQIGSSVGGLKGLPFISAAGSAVLFTLAVSSAVQSLGQRIVSSGPGRRRGHRVRRRSSDGLDALREVSYLDVVGERIPLGR